jgi:hypothetical protein
MNSFFNKKEEKQPFGYSTIVEVRKGSNKNVYWVVGIVIVLFFVGVFFFLR